MPTILPTPPVPIGFSNVPQPDDPPAFVMDFEATAGGDYTVFRNVNVKPSGALTSTTGEPTVTMADTNNGFFTGNWHAARTRDAGASWTLLGEAEFAGTSLSRVLVDPADSDIVWATNAQGRAGFVCTTDPGPLTHGVWKSLDGGVSWNLVLGSAVLALQLEVLANGVIKCSHRPVGLQNRRQGVARPPIWRPIIGSHGSGSRVPAISGL